MAKSAGGFMRIKDLVEQGYSPLDYRYYLLGGHYRSPLAFSLEALDGARNALNRIRVRVAEFKKSAEKERNVALEDIYKNEFLAVVSSDLNTSKGLALVWKVIDDVKVSPASKLEVLAYFDQLLGLDLLKEVSSEEVSQEIKALAQERVKLRQEKKWLEADEVRGQIADLGYEVLDTEDGYELKKK
jgi:cysteinyl-tRNA synthetase